MRHKSPEQALEQPVPAMDTLLAQRERTAVDVKELERLLESKRADLAALDRAIGIIEGLLDVGDAAPTVKTGRGRSAPRNRQIESDIDLTVVNVDFTGTEELPEQLVRVAETVPALYLNVTQVSKLLLRHGVTQSTLHNLQVNTQRAFDARPELWKRIRAATYQYTGSQDAGPDWSGTLLDPIYSRQGDQ